MNAMYNCTLYTCLCFNPYDLYSYIVITIHVHGSWYGVKGVYKWLHVVKILPMT